MCPRETLAGGQPIRIDPRRRSAWMGRAGALRSDPGLVPRFVEEVVRLEPPFEFHYRAVLRECRLAGFDLVPGDRLVLL